MTEVLVDDIDEVIKITKDLIKQYLRMKMRFKKQGMNSMSNSANGSIVGLVRLLSMITDKDADEYFVEVVKLESVE